MALIDIDAHHGNGSEQIVRAYPKSDQLLFFSIHLYDKEAPVNAGKSYEFYPGYSVPVQTNTERVCRVWPIVCRESLENL